MSSRFLPIAPLAGALTGAFPIRTASNWPQ